MGYKESDYQTKQHNLSNMAQFGMSQEHKDMLRKNRVFLIEELDPEPIIQRLFQINMIPKAILEDIQALPTNYHKCIALLDQLPKRGPKAFQNFCRILSAVGQPHIRSKIQPEGAKWCVDLRTVITYDGITLGIHKGQRSVLITFNQWNKLIQLIPEIQMNLNLNKDTKLHLEGDLYVITGQLLGLMYVGLHRFAGTEMIEGTGLNMTMDEWTEFLAVMDSITEEVSESHPKPDKFDLYQLINLSYIYILERDIIARAANNCYGCQHDSPGQRDHMQGGCLSDWGEMAEIYFTEAVMSFSRPLFAEICR